MAKFIGRIRTSNLDGIVTESDKVAHGEGTVAQALTNAVTKETWVDEGVTKSKVLSQKDFTKELESKLDGVASGANNYELETHGNDKHSANYITADDLPTNLSDLIDDTATTPIARATGDAAGNSIATTYVKVADIVNTLTSTATGQPLSAAQGKAIKDLLDGKQFAKAFASMSALVSYLNSAARTEFLVAFNLLIVQLTVPDFWITEVMLESVSYTYTTDAVLIAAATSAPVQVGYYKISPLETAKVDLTDYVQKTLKIAGLDLSADISADALKTALNIINNLIVANIAERDALTETPVGTRVHVDDATDDETVRAGWAEYLCKGSSSNTDPINTGIVVTKGETTINYTYLDPDNEMFPYDSAQIRVYVPEVIDGEDLILIGLASGTLGDFIYEKGTLIWIFKPTSQQAIITSAVEFGNENIDVSISEFTDDSAGYNGTWNLSGFIFASAVDWEKTAEQESLDTEVVATLIYDTDGGSTEASKEIIFGRPYGTLPTPTKSGYNFIGWFTAAENGTQVTEETIAMFATEGDVTLYAQWVAAPTEGLSYTLINEDTEYEVSKGTATAESVIIPSSYNGKSVTQIAYEGFRDYAAMTSVSIPTSINVISGRAFWGCTGLTTIYVPDSVTTMHTGDYSYVFRSCSNLSSVRLSNSLTIIKGQMFEGCTSLNNLIIPASVTRLYGNAIFSVCTSLNKLTLLRFSAPDTITILDILNFGDTPIASGTGTITVPYGAGDVYKAAANWSTYAASIIEAEEPETVITNKTIAGYIPAETFGAAGVDGHDGADGADGQSAYKIWLAGGHTGTEADFLASLKGADGQDGADGVDGSQGPAGQNAFISKNTYTLTVSGWSGYSQDVLLESFDPAEDVLFISPAPADACNYLLYGLYVSVESLGKITVTAAIVPDVDININIAKGAL